MLLFSLFCCHKNKIKGQRTHRKNSALFDFPLQTSWKSQYILVIHIRHNVGNGTTQANEEHGGRPGKKKRKQLITHPFALFNAALKFLNALCKFIRCYTKYTLSSKFSSQCQISIPNCPPVLYLYHITVLTAALSLANLFAVFIEK